MGKDCIRIVGARQHNLKNLTLSIPRDRLVVITGLSGSGKSSLAFDTLFAEGQRKYVESLSAYARQFLDQMQKPDVDYIEGLSPTIAIEQRSAGANPRSIIATTTEIYDYLRLLFAHLGQPHCPVSGQPIARQTTTEIVDRLVSMPARTRLILLAPVAADDGDGKRDALERFSREGFVRARVDGQMIELNGPERPRIDPEGGHRIEVVVDRLVVDDKVRVRLADSVETALHWGRGRLVALHQPPGSGPDQPWTETTWSNRCFSPATGLSYDPPTPKHFSFNAPQGACPACHGLGQELVWDEDLVVPDRHKSLDQGAVAPWRRGGKRMVVYYKCLLRGLAEHYGVSLEAPYLNLPESFRQVLLHGSGETEIAFHFWRAGKMSKVSRPFEGVMPNLERLYQETESEFTRNRLKGYMSPRSCQACGGRRLKPEILAVTLGAERPPQAPGAAVHPAIPGCSIMDVCGLTVEEALAFFQGLALSPHQQKVAAEILREIRSRLRFLLDVGLGYLTLDRESGTLSGGEAQRIRLATQIGAGLVGVLYILDEPSIGLHQRDNEQLLRTLEGLRDLGNSVMVVEHDEETIRRADYILDLGPRAGIHGGELVAAGTLAEILACPQSLTGKYLRGELSIPSPSRRIRPGQEKGWIEVIGARQNNLKNIDVRIPLGTLCAVTGVSGSGKSTLVDDILRRALFREFYGAKEAPGAHRAIRGTEQLDKVIVIDQTPIGRTPRSNPATYTGMFNHIRDLFARLPAARIRGYDAGRFSFNVKGGRCEKCQGDGLLRIEMHFLPPVYVVCEGCSGRRYNRETLEITYKGRNIAEVLSMTVEEAVEFFRAVPAIHDLCATLAEVGLGYLALGQSATTLSGGEAQRVKLASELGRKSTGQTLYILDEPTTGLHFHDVAKLLDVLFRLRAAGNTLLVIEHNLDVIKNADWIVDLGPEGGEGGGRVVAEGTPEQVCTCEASHTGRFLRRALEPLAERIDAANRG
ncbi:MAG TPA: excinuclease ABC subunit UvrA [Candidatus Paceibacterota bacterium]|nr:excinuclease ABC subunit UvrA [Verrucomicrobiota bacterium]HOX02302.1 excinuclease ABC subunit UvrA [Verrucomicrobiota bacterium]HRZ45094.1 excinuclease ABC subunit UvrA [Candidatus Paceibacterota bacterium]